MGDRIDAILARVLRPIPAAYVAPPTPRSTWAKLKLGDTLELRTPWFSPALGTLPAGTTLTVVSVDSEGVKLALSGNPKTWRWESKGWETTFTKLTKRQVKSREFK